MTDERAIIKLDLGLKTGAGSSHGKPVQAPIRFVTGTLLSFYDYQGRLATASERNG